MSPGPSLAPPGAAAPGPRKPAPAPEAFVCPITKEIMRDPVVDSDGVSYERAAVEAWVREHGTSPVTRRPLSLSDLRPNRALLDLIAAHRADHPELAAGDDAAAPADPAGPAPPAAPAVPAAPADPAALAAREAAAVRLTAAQAEGGRVVVTVHPPTGEARAAVDLCCVVDVSGAMGAPASVQAAGGGAEEDTGLTVLDVVKHAIRTIVETLGPRDRLSIVAFHSQAYVALPVTAMCAEGKRLALDATGALTPLGSTNLWDGLRTGMDLVLDGAAGSLRNKAVFVLTDGVPNVEPPRGHLPALQQYLDGRADAEGGPQIIGETFGFGCATGPAPRRRPRTPRSPGPPAPLPRTPTRGLRAAPPAPPALPAGAPRAWTRCSCATWP